MKTSLILATLLFVPVLSHAEDAPDAAVPGAKLRKHLMEKFDADKDGKLSDTEREAAKAAFKEKGGEMHAKILEKFDADKDGKLSDTEREAAKAAMKARTEGAGKAEGKGEGKAGELRQKMLEKFDEDKDGQLNEAERAKAREARKNRSGV